jgi:hypothetical protein
MYNVTSCCIAPSNLLLDSYGVSMAEQCGLPAEVVTDARQMLSTVMDSFPVLIHSDRTIDKSIFAIHDLLQQLLLLPNSTFFNDKETLCNYLNNLRSSISDEQARQMLLYIKRMYLQKDGSIQNRNASGKSSAAVSVIETNCNASSSVNSTDNLIELPSAVTSSMAIAGTGVELRAEARFLPEIHSVAVQENLTTPRGDITLKPRARAKSVEPNYTAFAYRRDDPGTKDM